MLMLRYQKQYLLPIGYRSISLLSRMWSGSNGTRAKFTEQQLEQTLSIKFPKAKNVTVTDVSGGCGAIYEIIIESIEFKGKSRVKQHQMITDILKEEIKDMHGLRINTIIAEE